MSMLVSERVAAGTSPLSFTLSRGQGQSVVVAEAKNRGGGAFADLSSAIGFVETQGRAAGCTALMRFDASLAMIRAAG